MPGQQRRVVIVGGGAAGFFAAIACAEAGGDGLSVRILERGREVLQKVKISGGGRCNVTHHLDDPRALSRFYPRGEKSLIGPLHHWGQADTVRWFAEHEVELKAEADGRMFPLGDDSQTVIDCLTGAARAAGVRVDTGTEVASVAAVGGGFEIGLRGGESIGAEALLIATGGIRSGAARAPVEALGHDVEPAVPSLFTFKIDDPELVELAGVSVVDAELRVGGTKLAARGPLLVTHWGLSGPAVLKLSAWGARQLAATGYRFELSVAWLGAGVSEEAVRAEFAVQRQRHGTRTVARHSPFAALPRRLWARLVARAGIAPECTWARLSKAALAALCASVSRERFTVDGKSTNKDEFVTCGGVRLRDVDLKTMASRRVPGLYFAGEVLDIDGLTGGFNFQSAWTTGRIAGQAMARELAQSGNHSGAEE